MITIAITGSLVCLLLSIFAWRRRPAQGAGYIAGALFASAIYAFGYGLELSGNSLEAILIYLRFEYLGIVWLPGLWLAVALRYTNQVSWLKPPKFFLLWVIPILALAAFYTNPLHHLYYTDITLDTRGSFPVIQFEHGPIYVLQFGYIFFSIISSSALLFQHLLMPHALYRKQAGLILISNLLLIVIAILYYAGLQPIPNLDIVAYGIIVSSVIIGYALLRYHLVDLVPVAREMLFDRLNNGVFVLDGNDRLVDFNPEARRLLSLGEDSIGAYFPGVVPPDVVSAFGELRLGPDRREFRVERAVTRYYEVERSTIPGIQGEKDGLLLVVHEITPMKEMQIALEGINAELDERVKLKTQEYLDTIDRLENEVKIRQETEKKLQEMQNNLVEQVSIQSRRLYSLYDVLIHKESEGENGEILVPTLERIQEMMNADAVCIHEARDGKMVRIGSVGLAAEVVDAISDLPGGWLAEGKPLASTNLSLEGRVPQALRLPIYTGYLAAPIRLQDSVLGALQVFWSGPNHFQVEDISYFAIIAEQIGIILENDRLHKKLEEEAVRVERRRLARDLHDSVTQSLHSLLLNIDTLRHRLKKGGGAEKVEEMLARLEQSARQSLKEMRLLLFELRLAPLEDIRLVEALNNRLEAVEMRAGVDAKLLVAGTAQWSPRWEAELYCIAMEALNNSLKHSRADRVRVELCGEEKWLEMKITDNGVGFSSETMNGNGVGLQSMQERARRLGGSLQIESSAGQGTSICLQVGDPPVSPAGSL